MSSTIRTFFAVPLPQALVGSLDRLQRQILPDLPGARFVRPDQFHVTLAFLGDVADADLDRLGRAVAGAVAPFEPFTLEVKGLGAFPGAIRARTLWAGLVGSELPKLAELQRAVAGAARGGGWPPADERFSPHVTLARLKTGRGREPDVGAMLARNREWSAGAFMAAEVVLFSSELTPQGPMYSALTHARLEGRKLASPP